MRPNLKRQLVEQLNAEFEKLLANKEKSKYSKYIRETSEKIIDKRPKNRIEMQKIIRQQKLDTKTATKMFNVLANTTALIMNPPKDLEQQKKLQPLQQIMRAYSVTSPRTFANSVYQMTTGRNMSTKNEQFRPAMLSYYNGFTENIETADQQYQRALQRSTLEAESAIFKDFEDLRRERVPITKQKTLLLEKYGSPVRVQRILETELHEQAERTKLETSKFMQYTHKEWNTQRDERVRKTKFHTTVDRKRIPIDSNFKGGGFEAEYPGDIKLPPGERINCRCYIVYFNDPKEKVKRTPITVPPTVAPDPPEARVDNGRGTERDNNRIYNKETGQLLISKSDIDIKRTEIDYDIDGKKVVMNVSYLDPVSRRTIPVPKEWLDDILEQRKIEAQTQPAKNADPEIAKEYKKELDNLFETTPDDPNINEKIRTVSYERNQIQDKMFDKSIEGYGYDAPPKLISREDFEKKAASDEGRIVIRGYTANTPEQVDLYRRQMESGEFYLANTGGNAYGKGMYSATVKLGGDEKVNKDLLREGIMTGEQYTAAFKPENAHLDIMYLPKDFKILKETEIDDIKHGYYVEALRRQTKDDEYANLIEKNYQLKMKLNQNIPYEEKKIIEKEKFELEIKLKEDRFQKYRDIKDLNETKYINMRNETVALLEGADGYSANRNTFFEGGSVSHRTETYTIILNRSKVQLLDNRGENADDSLKYVKDKLGI
jgi:hypothetical protein